MTYVMLIHESPEDFAEREGEKAQAYWGAWTAYAQALAQSGMMAGGNGLQPPQASVSLRLRNGERLVQDGPYADVKEQLGGYFVLNADLETALDWAARCPAAAKGTIELRPVLPMQAQG